MKIPFNKPYFTGKETKYIEDAVKRGMISGNGYYTKKCQTYFQESFGFKKALLTTSCTDALEMCAMLANIKPGDEVIVPSYTFVSTALAFVRQGANIVFADSKTDNPNIDETQLETLITNKTKAIVVVHYAGVACNMDTIMAIANAHSILVIEDAAQAICSRYKEKYLGAIGHMAAFSFHETKNIISGEGGLLAINDDRFINRAEIIWEKGTNRAEFFRGEVNKYGWVDTGSSFLPSEIIAAFLWAQIENIDNIQKKRLQLWHYYNNALVNWAHAHDIKLMPEPEKETNNAHMFYVVCKSMAQRDAIIKYLKSKNILSVFHYLSLHKSQFYKNKHDGRALPNSDKFSERLLRLPMFYELDAVEVVKALVSYKTPR
ncbi:dTDP-4-amino-4,6-dideoxygalactose transaminase [Jejuia pallidilutea]|uniref:Lipopolysaccharide biosynthesis protein RffA n=1 Tax=Jejuia pallidilutea TaxID=504487 RepID=A0A090VWF5_9FLAO|nr:dTDP-4-amino-4,6-dideoxygalactose transaminase [Jejuia pallidilutea]GAL67609.1 lipopolysaccharide biosynthesis protein RffA [Jejuia pallidilutea]GAL71418.1 lipopolysaccharide biosynthesis protein RffA [Jejuia pallidilutea]GAL89429.1 lipopolysaccharide biosynthesis protein RffA [Jejuia pallidilutea]